MTITDLAVPDILPIMKILCLHGRNQSARTFREQLDAVIKVIVPSGNPETRVSFDFIDAPIHCAEPTPDGQAAYKFFNTLVISEIHNAHKWLTQKLGTDGPYDGVIGFCEGAALVSSYLLYHQWYRHEQDLPFRFATFISGSISLAVLRDLGVLVPGAAERVVEETELRRQGDLGPLPSHVSLARRAVFNSDDCFGLNLNQVPLELKIKIPTVHVWGANDPSFPTSIHVTGLCDPYIRKIYTHGGGHEVPQGTEATQELGKLVLWCMQQAIWPGHLRTP
ncbi:putative serine hydrolase [Rosellinia necatrix]|uniref:Putative serine hydrolase n=1 Tax=Rosellinia necatrix TaxID=77044 RepID=A0A1S7UHX4_ROSNE|nr:putative serine hydrolase [Rosellinia necatrix]